MRLVERGSTHATFFYIYSSSLSQLQRLKSDYRGWKGFFVFSLNDTAMYANNKADEFAILFSWHFNSSSKLKFLFISLHY